MVRHCLKVMLKFASTTHLVQYVTTSGMYRMPLSCACGLALVMVIK